LQQISWWKFSDLLSNFFPEQNSLKHFKSNEIHHMEEASQKIVMNYGNQTDLMVFLYLS